MKMTSPDAYTAMPTRLVFEDRRKELLAVSTVSEFAPTGDCWVTTDTRTRPRATCCCR